MSTRLNVCWLSHFGCSTSAVWRFGDALGGLLLAASGARIADDARPFRPVPDVGDGGKRSLKPGRLDIRRAAYCLGSSETLPEDRRRAWAYHPVESCCAVLTKGES